MNTQKDLKHKLVCLREALASKDMTERLNYMPNKIDMVDEAIASLSQPNEPIYQVAIMGNWFDTDLANYVKESGIKRTLYKSPPTAQPNEPVDDLSKCPMCGGVADNGIDRCIPPSAYMCSKCCDDEDKAKEAQPNEPVGKIDATDDGDCGTQYWGELDMAVLHERGFKVGDNLFLAPPNLEAKIAELTAKNKELENEKANLLLNIKAQEEVGYELIAKSEQMREALVKIRPLVQVSSESFGASNRYISALKTLVKALEECK